MMRYMDPEEKFSAGHPRAPTRIPEESLEAQDTEARTSDVGGGGGFSCFCFYLPGFGVFRGWGFRGLGF